MGDKLSLWTLAERDARSDNRRRCVYCASRASLTKQKAGIATCFDLVTINSSIERANESGKDIMHGHLIYKIYHLIPNKWTMGRIVFMIQVFHHPCGRHHP